MTAKMLNDRDMDFIVYEWLDACQLTYLMMSGSLFVDSGNHCSDIFCG